MKPQTTPRRGAIGRFVDDWRSLLALPDDALVRSAGGWETKAGAAKESLRLHLHWKISGHCTWYGYGRKWRERYQNNQMCDCDTIRRKIQHGVQLYQLATPELRRRYAHLLDDPEKVTR